MIRILAGTSASFQALNFRNTGGSANMYYRGNAAGRGGFTLRWIFGVNAVVDTANFKYFVGLRALTSASATSFVPSDGVDCVYIGRDAGDTNMQLMHNDSGLTCTKIDLGSDFPAATAGIGIVLDLTCAGNDGNITYKVQRYDTAGITPKTGTISSNLPTNSTFMNPHMFVCNGTSGTPGVAALDHVMVVADVPYMVFTP
jgi:hypothetical protein